MIKEWNHRKGVSLIINLNGEHKLQLLKEAFQPEKSSQY